MRQNTDISTAQDQLGPQVEPYQNTQAPYVHGLSICSTPVVRMLWIFVMIHDRSK